MTHKLFCFPFAGGNAEFYDGLEKELDGIDVIKLEYAGHGKRYKEPLYRDFEELIIDLYPSIREEIQKSRQPYAMMGYSMGSISAALMLGKILDDADLPLPGHIFLAAHEPFPREELSGYTADELDRFVKCRTISFGDIPEKLKENAAYWRMYLPVYRADYSMIGRFDFDSIRKGMDVSATIFYSESDTPYRLMRHWRSYFDECEFIEYTGSHFFIREHYKEVGGIIKKRMLDN